MESELITFRTFDDVVLANGLGEQLADHQIEYTIEEEAQLFNGSSIFNSGLKKYVVKIAPDKFEEVNNLLVDDEVAEVAEIGDDYYLFSFTNDELKDLLAKADEWGAFDIALAKKLLAERGVPLTDETIAELNDKRIEELKVVAPPQTGWIIAGYIFAVLGGVLGIFIGWHLSSFKKTLPDGERVFEYSENDRQHGKRIFYISIVFAIIGLIIRILNS